MQVTHFLERILSCSLLFAIFCYIDMLNFFNIAFLLFALFITALILICVKNSVDISDIAIIAPFIYSLGRKL